MVRRRHLKESALASQEYKEKICDYLDELGLWVDDNQIDELASSVALGKDCTFEVCVDSGGEEWFWTYDYDSKHHHSSAYINAYLTISSRFTYSNTTYMIERIYNFVEFLNNL